MPITYQCRACGCAISERQIRNGEAKRDGADLYCVECSTLIADPADAASPSVGPAAPTAAPAYGRSPSSSPAGSGRRPGTQDARRQGSGLNGAPRPVQPASRTAGSSARQAAPPARGASSSARQAAPGARPGASARQPAPPQASVRTVEPSARRHASSKLVEPEARQRPSSRRIEAASRRTSAQQVEPAAPTSSSRRGNGARASRRAQAADVLEEPTRNVEYSSGTSRMRPMRGAQEPEPGDDPRARYSTRGTAPESDKGKATLIAMIAGGLVVIGLVALLAVNMGGARIKARARSEGPKSPQEYVKLADEQLRLGNKPAAIGYLHKASEGWSEIGQDEEARRCMIRAYSIGKTATFGELDR